MHFSKFGVNSKNGIKGTLYIVQNKLIRTRVFFKTYAGFAILKFRCSFGRHPAIRRNK